MGRNRKNQRNHRLPRASRIALAMLVGAIFAWPAVAAAAPLPGLPGWTGTTPWWTKLPGWSTLPIHPTLPGNPTPTPTPPATPTPTPTPPPGGGATPGKGTSFSGTYTNAAGSRAYRGYVPSTYKAGTPVPLLVVLHGCTESADVFRQLTRFDELAEAKGFLVVFPEQPKSANNQNCWNFFQDAQTHRGTGEPSLIAGITDWVGQHYSVDSHRIYVAGLSAGGAMASVMAATYPDVYAAIGIGSGCEYAATATCAGYKSADPAAAAQAAYKEMGTRARAMPVISFSGDKDTTVPPVNADQLLQQWQLTADLADDGATNGSVLSKPTSTISGQVPNGLSYTVRSYGDAQTNELVQYWVVNGMSHAWSGGCSCQPYAEPKGPDATAAMYAFFVKHPMP
jgi:poly(hydroxyalkanoate) depolymerase family esterase